MAVTVTKVGNNDVFGSKHVKIVDLAFSGNYPDEGEPLTAAALGFTASVEGVFFDGVALASDGETALLPKYDYATSKVEFYESAAAGTAFPEKTAAEAYPTGLSVRALVFGKGV